MRKTLCTKDFRHIKAPCFMLLKTFLHTLQNWWGKIAKSSRFAIKDEAAAIKINLFCLYFIKG